MVDLPSLELLLSPWGLGLLGLLVGSFLNVVIHRLPAMLEREWWSDVASQLRDRDSFRRTFAAEAPPGLNQAGNYELRVENGTRALTFLHQRDGLNDTLNYRGPAVADGVWQHVAVTAVKDGNVDFYLNGELTGSQALGGIFGTTNTSPLYIGSRADLFTTMDGLLDDVRLYDEVLSASDILDLAGGPLETYPKLPLLGAIASSEFTADGRLAAHQNGSIKKFLYNKCRRPTDWKHWCIGLF